MDRRVFQPRPSGSDGRRRSALMTAILVLAAGGLWLYAQRTNSPQIPPATNNGGVRLK